MAIRNRTRYVDVADPALGIECPGCRLVTPRFTPNCRNCGYSLWPHRAAASAAFQAWRGADPARARARPYDIDIEEPVEPNLVDYEAKARGLGIHLFPGTRYPIIICIGFLFLALAAVPIPSPWRLVTAILGAVIFLVGVGGWWLVEDIKMYKETVSHEEGEH